ncbi:hypothetical protein [Parasedimentitalea psychrophila]|uniref:Uncharacterized protein n=1 Tax=Parasedimentitalea psychrophila TaxID=2997337 RepID=A0A9Y2P265_9RHOB|nr:hypothetical protein [Parasedimentitalea psychrophila]WIY26311.1 hypothetical protein QPJ95_05135 [Parasedimentitalea psychrophila]
MFILSLRGKFGISIALWLHGLAALMTIVLFGSTALGFQLTALLIFLAGSVFVLRYMNQNKERLIFNSPTNRQVAYPSLPKIEKATAYLQGTIFTASCLPLVVIRLLDADMPDIPTGVIVPVFYGGTLAFIGILQSIVRSQT